MDREEVRQIIESARAMGETPGLSGANLAMVNLSSLDLSGANLSEVNLSQAKLYGVNLSEANLSEANLRGAKLYEANLSGANLSKATLSEANLYWANLYGADLSLANLSRANLTRTDLKEINLRGAKYDNATACRRSWGRQRGRRAGMTRPCLATLLENEVERAEITEKLAKTITNLTREQVVQIVKSAHEEGKKPDLSETNLS
ncbi:pentapeptide repeat-containing protein [Chloroflexota bacterium]